MKDNAKNAVARRHLDARLNNNAFAELLQRPPRGWVKAIREALGMTTAQLARRLGIAQSSVVLMERSEGLGRIRLDTLERAAAALNCRLVYALVPNQSLEALVQARKQELAERQLASVAHSMRLEDQSVQNQAAQAHDVNAILAGINSRTLWDDL